MLLQVERLNSDQLHCCNSCPNEVIVTISHKLERKRYIVRCFKTNRVQLTKFAKFKNKLFKFVDFIFHQNKKSISNKFCDLYCYLLVSSTICALFRHSQITDQTMLQIYRLIHKIILYVFTFFNHPGPFFFLSGGIRSFDFLWQHGVKISSLEFISALSGLNRM